MGLKAVIVAAGYGTRFLPVTRCLPKEMFSIAVSNLQMRSEHSGLSIGPGTVFPDRRSAVILVKCAFPPLVGGSL